MAEHPAIEYEFHDQLPVNTFDRELHGRDMEFALFHHHPDFHLDEACTPLARVRSGIYGDPKLAGDAVPPLSPEQVSELPFIMPQPGSERERQALEGLANRGIVPRNIICHTEYFDVAVAMVESGIGAASMPESLLSPRARSRIACLFPVSDWLLVYYRNPNVPQAEGDLVEKFLIDSVLRDPTYPTIETYL